MKVLHVYRTYFPETQGGLEETIRQICNSSNELGIETRVLAPARNPKRKIVRFDHSWVYQPKLNFEVASCTVSVECIGMFRRLQAWADVIHYHFPWPFADVMHLLVAPDKPSVVTYHSDIVRQRLLRFFYRPLMMRFLGSIDRIVCTSPNYFATSDVLSKFEDKVSVVPIGLDEQTYPSITEEKLKSVQNEYGQDFFLFVGVLRYYKGLHILIDAMKGAPFKVVIVGSGPTEKELKDQAEALGLDNVTFAGYVSDATKVALFKLSRAIVFPSYLRSEAFGVTLLEGAMFSKPLISAEVGSGTSHVNKDGETGIVVPPGSAKAVRKAMTRLYSSPDIAAEMGRRARRRYEELFTGRRMAMRYLAIYEKLTLGDDPTTTESDITTPAHEI